MFTDPKYVKVIDGVVVSRCVVARTRVGSNPRAVVFVRFLKSVRGLKTCFQFVAQLNGRVDWSETISYRINLLIKIFPFASDFVFKRTLLM